MTKFTILPESNAQRWDDFVEESLQGTVFSLSHYLSKVGHDYERYFIYKKSEIRAAFCCLLDPSGQNCELDDLVIYNEF